MNKLWMGMLIMSLAACGIRQQQEEIPAPQVVETTTAKELVEEEKITPLPERGLRGSGKVKAANYADISFRTQERIAHVFVKNGQRVTRGQKLADLEMTSLTMNLRQAEINMEQADLELQDILIGQGYDPEKPESVPAEMMKLMRVKSGYEQAALQRENALHAIEQATLVAPFDGIIANLEAKPHHLIGNEAPFCRIIQTENMEVEFEVVENELHLIRTGLQVKVIPQATSIGTLEGEICTINPQVDEKGLIKVRARVKGNKGLMEGMNVIVEIEP